GEVGADGSGEHHHARRDEQFFHEIILGGGEANRDVSKARQRGSVSRVLSPERVTQGDGHFSRTPVTRRLERPYPRAQTGRPIALLFGLAPGGVCLADAVTHAAGELLPHRFTLTAPPPRGTKKGGGLFLWH